MRGGRNAPASAPPKSSWQGKAEAYRFPVQVANRATSTTVRTLATFANFLQRRYVFRLRQSGVAQMTRRLFQFVLLLILLSSFHALGQPKTVDAERHQWWQHAVFYEIYPRS